MAHVTLVLGGARSGKSARALTLAGEAPHIMIATAQALDDEMAARIALHQAERDASWQIVEEPLELAAAVAAHGCAGTTLLIDCLTLWLSNLMHADRDCPAEAAGLVDALRAAPGKVVAVSNEVGMGLVPDNPLGRTFRDEQGRLNQRIAAMADRVEFVAAGLALTMKGQ